MSTEGANLRRRFHSLLVLRFVPTGLTVVVVVPLLRDRGLSLAEIGVGLAAQGLVALVLELPSGGLADSVGRRPVLMLATAVSIVATAALMLVHSVTGLVAVMGAFGVFRALDSGPLQSWFVDEAMAQDPDVAVERDLARSDVTICAALALGALGGSAVVRFDPVGGLDRLVAPLVVAVVVQVVALAAVATLMIEHRDQPRADRGRMAGVPDVVRASLATIRGSRILTALVVAELFWGAGAVAMETLFPAGLGEIAADTERTAWLLGPATTAAWIVSALGAAAAPWLVARVASGPAACLLRLGHAAAVAVMAWAGGAFGIIAAYVATYAAHGAANPVHYGAVHRAADSAQRATIVSANSLAAQFGFAVSGVALGVLADSTTIDMAMIVGAVLLLLSAPLYLVKDRDPGQSRGPRGTTFE